MRGNFWCAGEWFWIIEGAEHLLILIAVFEGVLQDFLNDGGDAEITSFQNIFIFF